MKATEIRALRNERGDIILDRRGRGGLLKFVTEEPNNGEWQVEDWSFTEQRWVQNYFRPDRNGERPKTVHSRDIWAHNFDIGARDVETVLARVEAGRKRREALTVAALLRARLPEGWVPDDSKIKAHVVTFVDPPSFVRFVGGKCAALVDGEPVEITRESFIALARALHEVEVPEQVEVIKPDGIPDQYWEDRHDLAEHKDAELKWQRVNSDLDRLARDGVALRLAAKRKVAVWAGPYPKHRELGDAEYRRAYALHSAWSSLSHQGFDNAKLAAERRAHPDLYTPEVLKAVPLAPPKGDAVEYYTFLVKHLGVDVEVAS